MSQQTPRTNAAANRAIETLKCCKSADEYSKAVKNTIADLVATSQQIETELTGIKRALASVNEALNSGDGSYKP